MLDFEDLSLKKKAIRVIKPPTKDHLKRPFN